MYNIIIISGALNNSNSILFSLIKSYLCIYIINLQQFYPCRQHTLYAGIAHTLQDKYVSFVRGYFHKQYTLVSIYTTHYAPLP